MHERTPLRRIRRTRRVAVTTGLNNLGDVVGKYDGPDGKFHGFLRDARGRYRRIDVPGALGTYASKINDHRQVVGAYNTESPRVGAPGTKGYVWDRGRFTTIAFPGAQYTQAFGINNRRDVVGFGIDALDLTGAQGFLARRGANGRITPVDVRDAPRTTAWDINDRQQIVGNHENVAATVSPPAAASRQAAHEDVTRA